MNKHEPEARKQSDNSARKILIVDDEPANRWLLAEFARTQEYDPVEAGNAQAALNAFAVHQPAVVLLDINLPDGSGLNVLRELKQHNPETIVIMITAELNVENTISALRGGADDFIGKPIRVDELRFALTRCLQARQRGNAACLQRPPQVLLISDDAQQLKSLEAAFDRLDVEITSLSLATEPISMSALEGAFDLVVVNVGPELLEPLLKQIRDDAGRTQIPVLVAASRVTEATNLAGVMPKYRAMPCGPNEILRLAEHRLTSLTGQLRASHG